MIYLFLLHSELLSMSSESDFILNSSKYDSTYIPLILDYIHKQLYNEIEVYKNKLENHPNELIVNTQISKNKITISEYYISQIEASIPKLVKLSINMIEFEENKENSIISDIEELIKLTNSISKFQKIVKQHKETNDKYKYIKLVKNLLIWTNTHIENIS